MAGPGQTSQNFEPTKAHCQLEAQASGTSFEASGSTNFVAGAAAGHAIGDAVRASGTFNACMRESGFLPVSKQTVSLLQSKKDQIRIISDDRVQCITSVRQEQQFAILMRHFSDVKTGKFSIEQLADQHQANAAETEVLPAYFDATSVCRAKSAAEISKLVSGADDVFLSAEQRFQDNAVGLVQHRLSWGDFSMAQQAAQSELVGRLKKLSLL